MRRKASAGEAGGVSGARERLARWLVEWQLDQALESGARVAGAAEAASGECPWETGLAEDFAAERPLAVGQIRLLGPAPLPPELTRPCFVAVLAHEADEAWCVAPFGRFAEPALPGEWLTGRASPPLRVMCLWGAWRLPAAALAASWVVDTLHAAEQRAALAVLAHATAGITLPAELAAQVGPPLFHPDDPRHVYRRRESALLARIRQALVTSMDWDAGTSDRRLAAEDRDPYGPPPPPDKPD